MLALNAMVQDDVEERIMKKYTADCLGALIRGFGKSDVPLLSEMIDNKVKKPLDPQEVVEHVKQLFS